MYNLTTSRAIQLPVTKNQRERISRGISPGAKSKAYKKLSPVIPEYSKTTITTQRSLEKKISRSPQNVIEEMDKPKSLPGWVIWVSVIAGGIIIMRAFK